MGLRYQAHRQICSGENAFHDEDYRPLVPHPDVSGPAGQLLCGGFCPHHIGSVPGWKDWHEL